MSLGRFRYSNSRNVVQRKSPSELNLNLDPPPPPSLPLWGEREMDARCTHADLSRRQSSSSVLLLPFGFCDTDSEQIHLTPLGIGPLENQLLPYEWLRYLMIKEGFKEHHSICWTARRLRGVFDKRCRTQYPNSVE